MPDNTQQRLIRDLFDAASDLPAAERQAWVEARAQGNAEVVASVMRLLHAAGISGQGFLAEPAWKRESPALQEGMMIGPYRVLRELGSGGMGVVYESVQESLGRARGGDGAVLIECMEFSVGGKASASSDPLVQMTEFLLSRKVCSKAWLKVRRHMATTSS